MFESTSPGASNNCRLIDGVFISEKVEARQFVSTMESIDNYIEHAIIQVYVLKQQ